MLSLRSAAFYNIAVHFKKSNIRLKWLLFNPGAVGHEGLAAGEVTISDAYHKNKRGIRSNDRIPFYWDIGFTKKVIISWTSLSLIDFRVDSYRVNYD